MPFGPTNEPSFYTAMLKDLKDEWDNLFILRIIAMKTYNNYPIVLMATHTITIADKPVIWGSKTIIDDILLWYNIKNFT